MCSICDLESAVAAGHPMTPRVAAATRSAMDAGRLAHPPADAPGTLAAVRARARALAALRMVQERLERVLPPDRLVALPDFFVLLIEMGTWGFFRATPTGFDPDIRPEPPRLTGYPRERDAVVVMSESAARALADGALPFERMVAEGLIALDADEARRVILFQAWSAAWPEAGFSRYVCAPGAGPEA